MKRLAGVLLFALAVTKSLRAQETVQAWPPPPTEIAPPKPNVSTWPAEAPSASPIQPIYPVYPRHMFASEPAPKLEFSTRDVFRQFVAWGGADYTMWWFRKSPLAVPLVVTTSSAPGPGVNILGVDPNARVILGPQQVEQNLRDGGRAWLGFWFGGDSSLGLEVVGLWIESPSERMGVHSETTGVPFYSRPIVMPGGVPGVYDISYPGAVHGSFIVQNHQLVRGLETNFIVFGGGDHRCAFELLAGARFLELDEQLDLHYSVNNLVAFPAFGGQLLAPGVTVHALDSYRALNQFYGGQLGGRVESNLGRLSLAFSGKIAMGVNDMTLRVEGLTSRSDSATIYPAGILANAANVGRFHDSRFAYVPEGQFSVGWWFTPNLRLKVGYNVLYISDVIRPGSQISNAVNPAAVPVDPVYGSSPITRTAPQFLRTDFWAEGITFGIDFRY